MNKVIFVLLPILLGGLFGVLYSYIPDGNDNDLSVVEDNIVITVFGSGPCPENLPEGYKLLKSPEGKYSLMIPNPPLTSMRSVNVWDSACDAKRFALAYNKYMNEPIIRESDKYQWEELD